MSWTIPPTAILLAAGRARRLGSLTDHLPKCLLEVGGETLIGRQIRALRAAGVERIVIVTGWCDEEVRKACGEDGIDYVYNEVFETTNSVYSLHLASHLGRDGFVLANADVLFHPALLERLVRSPHPDALLYEPNTALGDEEMKVRLEGDRVRAMAKTLPHGSYHGENLGVLKFSAAGAQQVAEEAARLVEEGDVNAWAPKAFDAMCGRHPIHAVANTGLPWIEIDFPKDLERARKEVLPLIELGAVRGGRRVAAGEGG